MKEESEENVGLFRAKLQASNKSIKKARREELIEDGEEFYLALVQSLRRKLRSERRNRDGALDLAPEDTTSMAKVNDFDGNKFAKEDHEAGVKIRNLEIEVQMAESRYLELFGKEAV